MMSVVIPVYNKWELTRQCLASLAATGTPDMEVLVVDNASSDATSTACEPTGKALFGERFSYLQQETNRNFSGACNIGARAAQGEWLFLLNNDTLHTPGWDAPLVEALQNDSTLGAVGPLLSYPADSDGVQRVQHAGVVFSPDMHVSHLYEFFPSVHPLVHKRRRFQVITGAAMMFPAALFAQFGGFDEGYINGFEDVDLCLNISAAGFGFAVIPESRMTHLCGQTRGNNAAHEPANGQRLIERGVRQHAVRNKLEILAADGYRLTLSPWLTYEVELAPERLRDITRQMRGVRDEGALRTALLDEPYWMDGYARLAAVLQQEQRTGEALGVWLQGLHFKDTPEIIQPLRTFADMVGQHGLCRGLEQGLRDFCLDPIERLRRLREIRKHCRSIHPTIAHDAERLLANEARFVAETLTPLRVSVGL